MAKIVTVVTESRRAQRVEVKAAEEFEAASGGQGVQETDASVVVGDDVGQAPGKPASPAEAPTVQARACEGSCGSVVGAVSGTPDQPQLSAAASAQQPLWWRQSSVEGGGGLLQRRPSAEAMALQLLTVAAQN